MRMRPSGPVHGVMATSATPLPLIGHCSTTDRSSAEATSGNSG